MAQKLFAVGSTQSIDANQDVRPAYLHLSAAAATATATVKSNGVAAITLAAPANGNDSVDPSISPGVSLLNLQAPVTVDVAGTGATLLVVW